MSDTHSQTNKVSSARREPVRVVLCSPWHDALWVLVPTLFCAVQDFDVLWVSGVLLELLYFAEGSLSSTLDCCDEFPGCM